MSEQPPEQERRKFERVPVSFIVLYKINSPLSVSMKVGEAENKALALDISEGGIAIFSDYELPPSAGVTVQFTLMDDTAAAGAEKNSRSIEVSGEVCYDYETEQKAHRIGIKFVDLSDNDRAFIAEFVRGFKNKILFMRTKHV